MEDPESFGRNSNRAVAGGRPAGVAAAAQGGHQEEAGEGEAGEEEQSRL